MSQSLASPQAWDDGSGGVHGRLTRMIVHLELAPGTLVSETALLKQLGTDRVELRQAVKRLEQARLVMTIPRVGIAIAPLGFREIQTVYEARFGLEAYTARLAAARATEAGIKELEHLVADLHAAGGRARGREPGADVQFVERDFCVHTAVVRMAQNPILEEVMGSVLVASARIWNAFYQYARSGDTTNYFVSHDNLLHAIAEHDPDAAEAAVREHLDISWSLIRVTFEAVPSAGLYRRG
jgi:DNA-binding GntR family transcriptional regulator